jgi:magnesium chelatase family protein
VISRTYAAQLTGLRADIITVEVDISRGLHSFSIVGLADKIIDESRERLNAALKNSNFPPPARGNKKIVVSLAPAHIKKEGALFDIAIALGILAAAKTISFNPEGKLFLGELSLNGDVRPTNGILLLVKKARDIGFTDIFVPHENRREAAFISGVNVYGIRTLSELVSFIDEKKEKTDEHAREKIILTPEPETKIAETELTFPLDFFDVRGQEQAKRGLEIAAAGNHNIALVGPPGTGKTLLAKAFPSILPKLTFDEMIEVIGIRSASGALGQNDYTFAGAPPISSPHHTASYVSLVGGGTYPKPGEITLAHRGVLFLDEFPEFEKRVIESLRQPLEDKVIHISRVKDSVTFPAHFILLAAMNPCPCGNIGRSQKVCICTDSARDRYKRKISGPIADRIDLWISVPELPLEKLSGENTGESSAAIRARIQCARELQKHIFEKEGVTIKAIGDASVRDLKKIVHLNDELLNLLNDSAKRLGLTGRGYHKALKVAHTICYLEGKPRLQKEHLLEALQYRQKEFT